MYSLPRSPARITTGLALRAVAVVEAVAYGVGDAESVCAVDGLKVAGLRHV